MSVQTGQTKTSKTTQKEDTMTQSIATQQGSEQAADKGAIRPFRVNVPEADLPSCASASLRPEPRPGTRTTRRAAARHVYRRKREAAPHDGQVSAQ